MTKKRCGIYIRVSTQMQVEEGYSYEEQKEILIKRAEHEGYDIYQIYADAGISAKNVKDRPEMQRLIKDIEKKNIDIVLAWNLKRTFRNLKDLLEVFEAMRINDCYFHFEKDGIVDPNTSSGKIHAQILGMVAEIERDGISEAVSMGMEARAKQGLYNGGTPPYGYKLVRDGTQKRNASKLEIDQTEAAVVREIFEMYLDGSGYKHILQVINKEGHRTKKGKLFSTGTIKGILTNEVYAGWIVWGKVKDWSEKRRKGTNPNPVRVRGVHEPIVSQEMFDEAKKIRLSRGGRPERVHDDLNILTGILRCPECGSGMVLSRTLNKDGKSKAYYSCGLWKNKGACGCHSNNVSLEAVNDKVLQEVSKLVNDEVVTRRIIRSINRATSNEAEGIQYDIESNKRALHRTQSDIKNLQERFESSDDIEPDQYKRRMRELRQHEEIYKKRISECNHAASNIPTNTYTPEQIRDILSRIKPILEKSDVVELRALMHLMIDRIEIDPKTRSVDTIKIKFNKELTDYLCIGEEGASKEASSFLLQKNIDEIMFELKVG